MTLESINYETIKYPCLFLKVFLVKTKLLFLTLNQKFFRNLVRKSRIKMVSPYYSLGNFNKGRSFFFFAIFGDTYLITYIQSNYPKLNIHNGRSLKNLTIWWTAPEQSKQVRSWIGNKNCEKIRRPLWKFSRNNKARPSGFWVSGEDS